MMALRFAKALEYCGDQIVSNASSATTLFRPRVYSLSHSFARFRALHYRNSRAARQGFDFIAFGYPASTGSKEAL